MQTVLVTGGAGYIGSHACKALAQRGYVPVTFDNLSTGWASAVKFGPFVRGDLLVADDLDRAFSEYQPVAVMHFAGLSQVGEASQKPGLYWRNNVLGSLGLVEAMARAGCRRIVFSSTCAVFGDQDGVLLNETSPQQPQNAYGSSKRAVEDILRDFRARDLLESVVFRYFNVAGADPEGDIGEWHRPETHLIPVMLQAAQGTRDAVSIFGTDYPTPDGTCIRDYIHVSDLIDAHILGLERLLAGGDSDVFNLGSGSGYSVLEVLDACQRALNQEVPHRFAARRSGDCAALVSDSQKAAAELGWQPSRSDLRTMIEDAWRWHQCGGHSGKEGLLETGHEV